MFSTPFTDELQVSNGLIASKGSVVYQLRLGSLRLSTRRWLLCPERLVYGIVVHFFAPVTGAASHALFRGRAGRIVGLLVE